jgi:hypothetical protein
MTWPITRFKDAAAGGSWTPTDMNGVQDQILQVAGHRGYAEVLTDQATAAGGIVDLATVGPSVTVTVPANGGLVAVRADVELKHSTGAQPALVYLAEDGAAKTQLLRTVSTSFSKRVSCPVDATITVNPEGTTNAWAGGWMVFDAAPGAHTYKLVYQCVTSGSANFRNRKLWVATMAFA